MTIFEKFRFVYRDFLSTERSFLVIWRTKLVLRLVLIVFWAEKAVKI